MTYTLPRPAKKPCDAALEDGEPACGPSVELGGAGGDASVSLAVGASRRTGHHTRRSVRLAGLAGSSEPPPHRNSHLNLRIPRPAACHQRCCHQPPIDSLRFPVPDFRPQIRISRKPNHARYRHAGPLQRSRERRRQPRGQIDEMQKVSFLSRPEAKRSDKQAKGQIRRSGTARLALQVSVVSRHLTPSFGLHRSWPHRRAVGYATSDDLGQIQDTLFATSPSPSSPSL